jgi:hypothetical protein
MQITTTGQLKYLVISVKWFAAPKSSGHKNKHPSTTNRQPSTLPPLLLLSDELLILCHPFDD